MERNYYMVRAMDSKGEDFNEFFNNSIVAVGWSKVNIVDSSRSEESIIDEVTQKYYSGDNVAPQVRGRKLNEIRRFRGIKKGDYLLIPYYSSIRIAIAGDNFSYKGDEVTKKLDLCNQLSVKYQLDKEGELKTIPRNSLSEALQRRLRVRGSTVTNLAEFGEQIEKIFKEEEYQWTSKLSKLIAGKEQETRDKLLQNIKDGKTNLKTGGIGLEELVCTLFELEGYDAEVLSKNKFKGYADADVEATKADKFQDTKVLVQVKHHSGYSNDWGLQQLKEITEKDYQDHKLGFITTAKVSEKLREAASKDDIIVMDGEELVDWLFEHINVIDEDLLLSLGLSNIPMILV